METRTPEGAWSNIKAYWARVRRQLAGVYIPNMTNTGTDVDNLVTLYNLLRGNYEAVLAEKDTPGLNAYIQALPQYSGIDMKAHAEGWMTLVSDAYTVIETNLDTWAASANHHTVTTWGPTSPKRWAPRTFTPAQAASFVTDLQTIADYTTYADG